MSEEATMLDEETAPKGNIFISLGCSLAVLAVVAFLVNKLKQKREFILRIHLIYWLVAILVTALLPFSISQYVFSQLTLALIGCLLPVYESVYAVCTPDEEDDTDWLRYWTIGGIFFVVTEWIDNAIPSPEGDVYWFKIATFFLFWLYYPRTNGSLLIDEKLTQKYLAPRMRPLQAKMTNGINNVIQMSVNVMHLYLIWIFFMFLPQGLKRIVAVAIGVVYPFFSSVQAITTEDFEDDAYWLTYWACYGILFISMDFLETWLGWIPGFYSAIIFAEVYLMLPMFGGADKLFRKVLVPLFRLHEMLMLKDAFLVKKQIFKDLDPERASVVRTAIANFFTEEELTKGSRGDLMSSYAGIKPKRSGGDGEPTETSTLV